jgi:hypothetical protein
MSESTVLGIFHELLEAEKTLQMAEDRFHEMARAEDWSLDKSIAAFANLEIHGLREKVKEIDRRLKGFLEGIVASQIDNEITKL